nr:ABC transporter substrate-binding protein [Pseudomonadota bacterium]
LLLCSTLAAAAGGAENPPERLTVALDGAVNPTHAPLVVAQQKGFFTDHDLEVTLETPDTAEEAVRRVASGKADVAVTRQPRLHVLVGQGQPIKRIGTLIALPLSAVVVLQDSPVNAIADLKGRRIGYRTDDDRALLNAVLARHAVAPDQVTLAPVGDDWLAELTAGRVDAVTGISRTQDLPAMVLAGRSARAFFVEEQGIPPYDELILVANREKLTDARLRRFLRAVEQGVRYIVNHPEAAWQAFAAHDPALDTELSRRVWSATLTRFALRPAALDNGRYKRFATFLTGQGLINVALPVSNYALELTD